MAQDFIAMIEGKADLRQAKQDFLNFKQQAEQPIKLTFDTSGLNAIFTGLGKQAQQAGVQVGQQLSRAINSNVKLDSDRIRIDPKTSFSKRNIGGELNMDIKLAGDLIKQLDTISEKGGTLQKITLAPDGDAFTATIRNGEALINVLGRLDESEGEAGTVIKQWVTEATRYTVDYTNTIKQTQKEADSLAQKITQIQQASKNGDFSKQVTKMNADIANIGSGVNPADISKVVKSATEYSRIVTQITASVNGTSANPLQGQDLVNAYERARNALIAYNNALSELSSNAKASGVETGNAIRQAQNEAEKAAQKAKAEADELAKSIENIKLAFSNGDFSKQVAKMNADISNIGKGVNTADISKVVSSASAYSKIATQITASLNGKAKNPLQGQALVDAYTQSQNALQSYNNAFAEMQANAKAAGIETGNAMKQAQVEAEKLATKLDKVSQSFITGTFDANISKMEQGLMNISNTVGSDLVKKASDAAAEYYRITQQIATSINDPTQPGALQGQQLADAYKQAEIALQTYNNAMTEVRANTQKMLAEGSGQRNANQLETWAKNNSKALKKYGQQLDEIAQKMRNAKTQAELNDAINAAKNLKAEITAAGQAGMSFGDQFRRAFVHIGEFTGIYAFTSMVRQLPRQMIQEVIKIDTAMTELRKVSTASAKEISDYFEVATDSAYKYGQAINEVIDSTASWTRLGYDLEDASMLTDVTAELAQVGSGLDTKSATEGLQATIRGFGLAAEDAKRVGDLINEVADTQPIDALGIINGLERSSAAMKEMNNSLEETVGLITATTSVTQDATSAGTAWRTKFKKRNCANVQKCA